jgi:hypothetical protein
MLYVAYLDEFGHIGPFISRTDPAHKTSPVFGLGGIVLPYTQVRPFATWFYKLKINLLKYEIDKSGVHPAKWEKKGSALYTTTNVSKYRELRTATNRILNKIEANHGFMFYVGLEKSSTVQNHQPDKLYRVTVKESIKRLDQHFSKTNDHLMIILDEQETNFRHKIVETASLSMFGTEAKRTLIEPPIQAESHLYQTLQCADWMCGLVGKLACHRVSPEAYKDYEWAERYFGSRIAQVSISSSIRSATKG